MNPQRIRTLIRAASAVSSELAGALALRAFFVTEPRLDVRPADAATHAAAERDSILIRGIPVVTYRWGSGDDTVLLVHGWRGRASQFAPLVRELVAEGFHVVSFDAPAHGASGRGRTDLRDWVSAIEQLQRRHGRFGTIVGHSFGALAALTAVRWGATTSRLATIAGAGSPQVFIDQFSGMLSLTPPAKSAFERRFLALFGESAASMAERYDAVAHPLAPHVELLAVHDDTDSQVPARASARLVAAHADHARSISTRGFGHNRVLAADETLDAVTAFAVGGNLRVDDSRRSADSAD